ncbi:MAG TPA: hypothetical protein VL972_00365 [Solirubrobacteraceae bacterium]|nr:hypothetical protein [Solirubrobacteraceae bacterium]
MQAIEEHGQHDSLAGGRRREHSLQADVVDGLSDLLALGGVVGAQLGVSELQRRADGGEAVRRIPPSAVDLGAYA